MDIEIHIRIQLAKDTQREVTLIVSNETTIGSLIRKICKENDVPMKSSYVLMLGENGGHLRWSSKLKNCRILTGSLLILKENEDDPGMNEIRMLHCNLWWPFAFICFMIGIIGITAIIVVKHIQSQPDYEYGIVMDAGSSHTKLFVYKWNGEKEENTAVAQQICDCPVPGPGISSYETNPADLAPHMRSCLINAADNIPTSKHSKTPIYLGATAGVSGVVYSEKVREVNSTVTDEILKVVRSTIAEFPFKFSDPKMQARIISGAEEGLYSWVTINYLTGKFGMVHPLKLKKNGKWNLKDMGDNPVGALDMGGASTQMTFYPGDQITIPIEYSGDVVLYGMNHTVYTHSYLCYGVNEISRKFKALLVKSQNFSSTVKNPCGPMGNTTIQTYTEVFEAPCTKADKIYGLEEIDKNTTYEFIGTSNASRCMETVDKLFNFSANCSFSECSFNGTYQAPVNGEFYAFSNFFYEMDFLNLTKQNSTASLADYKTHVNSLCNSPWSKVKDMSTHLPEALPWYCFRGQYILSLLTKGYKFDDNSWKNIKFTNTVNKGTEIGWSLGFMISSSTSIPASTTEIMISQIVFILLCLLFVVFLTVGLGFIYQGYRYHTMKKRGLYKPLSNYGAL